MPERVHAFPSTRLNMIFKLAEAAEKTWRRLSHRLRVRVTTAAMVTGRQSKKRSPANTPDLLPITDPNLPIVPVI
jgi:hypothetical protein